jgi:hypothetical protein
MKLLLFTTNLSPLQLMSHALKADECFDRETLHAVAYSNIKIVITNILSIHYPQDTLQILLHLFFTMSFQQGLKKSSILLKVP